MSHSFIRVCLMCLAAVTSCCGLFAGRPYKGQEYVTFEMRYLTADPKADGVTDFHGETEFLDTEARVKSLGRYADFASVFWGDPTLSKPLFTDEDVRNRLAQIKPQPETAVRRTISMRDWRAYGYKAGKKAEQEARWKLWTKDGAAGGAVVRDGCLILDGAEASIPIKPLDWRFRMTGRLAGVPNGLTVRLCGEGSSRIDVPIDDLVNFELYGDIPNRRLFLSSEGKIVREIPIPEDFGGAVNAFSIGAPNGHAALDNYSFYAFVAQPDNKHTPYRMEMISDEDFKAIPSMEGWQKADYDDRAWPFVTLPAPHGGLSGAGESLYLRTKVQVADFKRAILQIEALDPAGEVWVNGQPAAVLEGRIPQAIDITEYLVPNSQNTLAVKVKPYYAHNSMLHTPSDHNVGWFLGRTSLLLTKTDYTLADGLVHTLAIGPDSALQHHRITVRNTTPDAKRGTLEVSYFPWFPNDGKCVAKRKCPVVILPQTENFIDLDVPVPAPELWSVERPYLYRVRFVLKDKEGKPIDDWVTTTGIRLIEQRKGVLYINGRADMLNGAQNFGYRLPLETVAKTIRCGTDEMVMRDLMMAKAMDGNLLRIHVHAEGYTQDGINDPRFAEYADQLGLFLIWQTSGWIREGETSLIDVRNYPLYMRQVFNHPSIAMWEGSNHPNRYKEHPNSESTRYFGAITRAMVETDSSRLASPSSHWQNSHIDSYDATIDYEGKPMKQPEAIMHRMVTRGNQDSYAGYGKKWTEIRNLPTAWAKKCLESGGDLCYFNFEHEESAAQPNWELAARQPWYQVQSYEWPYEEGSIGRLLQVSEWRQSQAWQAFSAWEAMKMQILAGVSGFSWCSLESGPNMFTYQKPLVDPFYVPKLAFHANRMVFQRTWAGSDNVDTVYGPGDEIWPVIFNLDGAMRATLTVELQDVRGKVIERRVFPDIDVPAGRSVTRLSPFKFKTPKTEDSYFIIYKVKT